MTKFTFAIGSILCTILSFSVESSAQTTKEVQEIVSNYDIGKLTALQEKFLKQQAAQKQKALQLAMLKGWPEFIKKADGAVDELMDVTPNGDPIYFSVDNTGAARSTRTNFLNSGGGLGLNLNGQNMIARVWDGGMARASHQEFGGRITVEDATAGPSGNSYHATHVTGTIGASGVVANAKGMAPSANVRTFNWTNDLSEATSEAMDGMLVSNHSYGTPIINNSGNSIDPSYIGTYVQQSRNWDELAYNAPYYLMVASAGNNGQDNNLQPIAFGYDKLTGNKVSKNNLVVANAMDASIASNGNVLNVNINSGSSQGPADDFRIKPDITGNGTSVFSTGESSNSAYGTSTGTSMAAPNVTGTLLLLQQHYNNLNFQFMKAATLKGLACHTSDDAGEIGPDPIFGWGLLNAKKAAETITNDSYSSWISEENLSQGETFTKTFVSDGVNPLEVSISWTDLPGIINSDLNSTDAALIHDLDIRVTKNGQTYYPWKLTLDSFYIYATNNSDNNVDNFERVTIPAASGVYTVTVTHKGNLQTPSQDFSLIATGVQSDFKLTSLSEAQVLCSNQTSILRYNHGATNASQNTIFSVVGAPEGSSATLNVNQAAGSQDVTITLANLQNATPGIYNVGLKGVRGLDEEIQYIPVTIYNANFTSSTPIYPLQNDNMVPPATTLNWVADDNAESYLVEIATDVNFANIVTSVTTTDTSFRANLEQNTKYFWRIIGSNRCGTALNPAIHSFGTGVLNCDNIFYANDFTDSVIETVAGSLASVPITVSGGITIGSIAANINVSHTYIEDIVVYLEGPEELDYPLFRLVENPCGSQDDISATFSDAGTALICNPGNPGISGNFAPIDPLYSLNNQLADGIWTLYVYDQYNGDGGSINTFSLNICGISVNTLKTDSFESANFQLYPNPANDSFAVSLPSNDPVTVTVYDLSGRKIFTTTNVVSNQTISVNGFADGMYLVEIQNKSSKSSKKLIVKK
ncbi:S8 family serine peptidase [Flavobacterium sp. NST-5]|uniref:S8 family serine peptidase n=1 Tax=Flavobacterium ichthyis TaxID=2698827 RepID=A0ABW9Z8U0_9FLAO|nr:S8 family serine peptidase [Flavobacterium ichthyis]NBL65039.1 S8 family serine peptidase [Flavobacterium ichthyis]